MRYISPANLTYLEGYELTLCMCVKLTLRTGTVLGFTDHDADLSVSGVTYRAKVGLEVGAMRWTNRLDTEETELSGIFSAETGGLTLANARLGLYNQSAVDIYLVRWDTSALIVPLKRGVLSSIIPQGAGFTATVRSLVEPLARKRLLRVINKTCDADLFDTRCGVTPISYNGTTDSLGAENVITDAGFAGPTPDSDLVGGKVVLTSGDMTHVGNQVKSYDSGTGEIVLVRPYPKPVANGTTFTVFEGCDKKASTCKDRFSNLVNFRGYPHVPDKDNVAFKIYPDDTHGGYPVGNGEDE